MTARTASILRVGATLSLVAAAIVGGILVCRIYMLSPWTRDGRVRTEVVSIAPEVAGRIVKLATADNGFVHRGDLLFAIDPESFHYALAYAQAVKESREQDLRLRQAESDRRQKLTNLSVSAEEQERFLAQVLIAQASLRQAEADVSTARLNLERTEVRAPVNGWVTNLTLREGDFAATGRTALSLVDADSFWVSGYFEETKLARIREGAPARIDLMGGLGTLTGRVGSIARGINDPNATPGNQGLATVNPTFTWVRLAQRIPVRIDLDPLPPGFRIAAGMTVTVTISEGGGAAIAGEARP